MTLNRRKHTHLMHSSYCLYYIDWYTVLRHHSIHSFGCIQSAVYHKALSISAKGFVDPSRYNPYHIDHIKWAISYGSYHIAHTIKIIPWKLGSSRRERKQGSLIPARIRYQDSFHWIFFFSELFLSPSWSSKTLTIIFSWNLSLIFWYFRIV